MHDSQWCLEQAKKIGEYCDRVIQTLLSHSVVDYLRAAQGIVGLQKNMATHAWMLLVGGHLLFKVAITKPSNPSYSKG
jgi:hypothetical protein